jgi:hypothetical protein
LVRAKNQGGCFSRLEELKEGRKPDSLKRKYQASGRHGRMSVLVDLEAGHLEIGNLVDKATILRAHEEMF